MKTSMIFVLCRWVILGLAAGLCFYVIWSVLVNGQMPIVGGGKAEIEYAKLPNTSAYIVNLLLMPRVIGAVILFFWLQKLFQLYEKSCYFSPKSMQCFIWIVVTNAALYAYTVVLNIGFTLYMRKLDTGDEYPIVIDLLYVFTLFVSLALVHALKHANKIENENKEFI
ncbi:hypothetical protein J3L16_11585 [Alteromonas sp. 5E99-2]|uniref:hypothetical protein n=1 Tax=Alteromonas sp. 5E99-2 TaxID=2817683 RepID=UPI001A98A716|nr:hypothetical protein [Alteromonas sp. 5E99-2]MBO1256323.1 hypothetical protein [Alteromonas sp. 5E99-2]